MSKNKFWTKSTEEDYEQMWNEYGDFLLHIVEIASVEKIFKNLDFAKASRIDQISFNLLKEGTLSSCDIRDLYCCECSHQKIVLDYFTTKSENFFATSNARWVPWFFTCMIALDELLLFLCFAFDDSTIDDEHNTHTRLECCTENMLGKLHQRLMLTKFK